MVTVFTGVSAELRVCKCAWLLILGSFRLVEEAKAHTLSKVQVV